MACHGGSALACHATSTSWQPTATPWFAIEFPCTIMARAVAAPWQMATSGACRGNPWLTLGSPYGNPHGWPFCHRMTQKSQMTCIRAFVRPLDPMPLLRLHAKASDTRYHITSGGRRGLYALRISISSCMASAVVQLHITPTPP